MIVLGKVYEGIADHFPMRRSEWIMLLPSFGMAGAFHLQPGMFDTSPSFAAIASWSDESTWATIVLACAVVRLAALTVNGTFHQFRFSPHLRLAAALTGLLFWSQWTLGFLTSYLSSNGSLSAVFAYGTFCAFELSNVYISAADIGGEVKRLSRRSQGDDRL